MIDCQLTDQLGPIGLGASTLTRPTTCTLHRALGWNCIWIQYWGLIRTGTTILFWQKQQPAVNYCLTDLHWLESYHNPPYFRPKPFFSPKAPEFIAKMAYGYKSAIWSEQVMQPIWFIMTWTTSSTFNRCSDIKLFREKASYFSSILIWELKRHWEALTGDCICCWKTEDV